MVVMVREKTVSKIAVNMKTATETGWSDHRQVTLGTEQCRWLWWKASVQPDLTWVNAVIELFPVVQPHLGETRVVFVYNFGSAPWEGVRGGLAEHVAHVGASGDL